MEYCNLDVTPIEPRPKLSKEIKEKEVDPTQYKRLIGSSKIPLQHKAIFDI